MTITLHTGSVLRVAALIEDTWHPLPPDADVDVQVAGSYAVVSVCGGSRYLHVATDLRTPYDGH